MTRRRGVIAALAGIAASYTYRVEAQDALDVQHPLSRPALLQIEFPEGPVADYSRPKPGTLEKEERQRKEAHSAYITLKDPKDYESTPEGVALRVKYGKRTVELTAKEIMDALQEK